MALYNLLILGLTGPTAHAQLSDVANFVSNGLVPFFSGSGYSGGGGFAYAGIAGYLLERSWLIVGIFVLLLLVRSGLKLIYGQSEEKFEEAKRAIANGLMAVVLLFLTLRIVEAFYNPGGSWNPQTGAAIFTTEILGIARWASTLVAALAIAMIVVAAFYAIFSIGSDDGLQRIKRAIFGVAAGIIIILLDFAFRATFGLEYVAIPGPPSPYPIIAKILSIITIILSFLFLIAVCVIIYAGIRMILSLGNEEEFNKMKSLIFRVLLGLFVILVSWIIIGFVVEAFS